MYVVVVVLGQVTPVAPVVGEPPPRPEPGPVKDPVKLVTDLVVVTVIDLVVEELETDELVTDLLVEEVVEFEDPVPVVVVLLTETLDVAVCKTHAATFA
jgi:hypothetical protein